MSLDRSMEKMETDAASLPLHEDLFILTHTQTVASPASLLSLFLQFSKQTTEPELAVCISQMITTSVCVASLSQVVRTLYQLLLLTNSKRPWFSHHDWWTIFTHPTKAEIVFSFFTQEVTLRRDLCRSCKSEGRALSHCYLLHTRAFRNVTDLWLLLPCAPQSPRGISVLNNTVV